VDPLRRTRREPSAPYTKDDAPVPATDSNRPYASHANDCDTPDFVRPTVFPEASYAYDSLALPPAPDCATAVAACGRAPPADGYTKDLVTVPDDERRTSVVRLPTTS